MDILKQAVDRPSIMGILNLTPDSFSDGGAYTHIDSALAQAERLLDEGADIIDVGGESTRPGARAVSAEEELKRVIPVIKRLSKHFDCPISIDTSKAEVMRAAVDAGANMINDVRALQEDGALTTAASLQVPVCLMHMQGQPRTMQSSPHYRDVVDEVMAFLDSRKNACVEAGIKDDQIVYDPGFGFGKTLAHNCELFQQLPRIVEAGYPVLVGVSRKRMIGDLTGRSTDKRVVGSAAAAALATFMGAKILRVHDVAQTRDAVRVAHGIRRGELV
ncbi:dihydropteroate synthase [gamma proteobacterium HTCC5015]|nr:dihydropteroate synthase [gamma proteobacterium HTCC5015]